MQRWRTPFSSLALLLLACSGRVEAPDNAVHGMGDPGGSTAGRASLTAGNGAGGAAGSGASGGAAGMTAEAGANESGAGGDAPTLVNAQATLKPTSGNGVTGSIHFAQEGNAVDMVVSLTTCPTGAHALHLHANASCSDAGNAAGGHWSPQGDGMGEVTCVDGVGSYSFSPPPGSWSIGAPAASDLLQHALILHEGPNLDPGARIACGIPAKVE